MDHWQVEFDNCASEDDITSIMSKMVTYHSLEIEARIKEYIYEKLSGPWGQTKPTILYKQDHSHVFPPYAVVEEMDLEIMSPHQISQICYRECGTHVVSSQPPYGYPTNSAGTSSSSQRKDQD